MRPRHAPSRPAAALWCAIALLIAIALPWLHAPHAHFYHAPAADAPPAAHTHHASPRCTHAQHHAPAADPAGHAPPDTPPPERDDHNCAVCHVIHALSTGAPAADAAPSAHRPAAGSFPLLAARDARPPAQPAALSRHAPRGPPAA